MWNSLSRTGAFIAFAGTMLFSGVVWEAIVCRRGYVSHWGTPGSLEWAICRGTPIPHHRHAKELVRCYVVRIGGGGKEEGLRMERLRQWWQE